MEPVFERTAMHLGLSTSRGDSRAKRPRSTGRVDDWQLMCRTSSVSGEVKRSALCMERLSTQSESEDDNEMTREKRPSRIALRDSLVGAGGSTQASADRCGQYCPSITTAKGNFSAVVDSALAEF